MRFTRICATTRFFVSETSRTPSARGMPLLSTCRAAFGPTPNALPPPWFFLLLTGHPSRVTLFVERIIRPRSVAGNATRSGTAVDPTASLR
jgi:hypothetical protein